MPPAQKCSREMARKLYYEFMMFDFLFPRLKAAAYETGTFAPGDIIELGTSPSPKDEKRAVFAELESYLLHTRLLHDFFFTKPTHDDVVAADFLPDWSEHCPPPGAYLVTQRKKLNKALAHISLKRTEYGEIERKWDIVAIHDELSPVIKLFLARLPDDQRVWFAEPDEE